MSVEVADLLADELKGFDRALDAALKPQDGYLTEVERTLYRRGKRTRPILLLLSARLVESPDAAREPMSAKTIRAAVSLEMLHVATLIHDDIVDDAASRRGVSSVNAARGRDVALLVGDLQFVQALRCFAAAVSTEADMQLVRLVLDAGFNLCRGQLDELAAPEALDVTAMHERWARTAHRKTATLLGLACEAGALLGGGRKRAAWQLGRYGRLLGRAFQIMDDLRDMIEPETHSGKPRGADLAQGRATLPLIYACDDLAADSPARLALRAERVPPDLVEQAADDVVATAGFMRAYAEARATVIEAVTLVEAFPQSPYRQALEALAYDIVNRGFTDTPNATRAPMGATP